MELDEFEILKRKASTNNHCVSVSGAGVGASAAEVGSSVTTSGKNSLVSAEAVEGAVLHVESNDTNTLAILHDEIKSKVFNEEVGIVLEGLTVESVEDGVTGTVSSSGASVGLTTLAVLQ